MQGVTKQTNNIGGGGSTNDKGYFANPTALNTAYPTGSNGWYAVVGSTDTVWVWDSGTTAWVNSGGSSTGTNLGYTASATNGIVTSDTGTDATIPLGNGTNAGLSLNDYTTAEKNKLAGIEAGADITDATNVDAAGAVMNSDYTPAHSVLVQQSGTGSPSIVSLGTGEILGRKTGGGSAIEGLDATEAKTILALENVNNTSDLNKPISTATQTALDGKANTSHTHTLANVTDVTMTVANLNSLDDGVNSTLHFHNTDRDRANHTGTQAISTVTGLQTALDGKVDENVAITGATKTKITYDAKGLVTAGSDATTADIAPSTNRNYVTDAQQTVIGNTSGTNTGDNAVNSLYSGLVSNATHTGEVTGATALIVDKTAITNKTAVTPDATDYLIISDTSDSGNLKKVLFPTGGTGDVVGPASAVDTGIAIFDGTTGKLIKDSGSTISSTGVVSAKGSSPILRNVITGNSFTSSQITSTAISFGPGTSGFDLSLTRSGAGILTVGATQKIQQNATPTVGDDLTNKTYVDTKKTDSMSTARLLGRNTAGTGVIEEITLGTNLSFSGTTLNASGGGGATNLAIANNTSTTLDVTSDTGTDATIPSATTSLAGLLTASDKTKLDGIATGAEVNVNADWNSVSGDSQILNKPTIPTQYTDELAQDAVGGIFVGSSEIGFTYNDATPSITASIVASSIDETKLDTSVNASLDLADTAVQPAGLTNYFLKTVDDTDDITIGATNKFATTAEKNKLGFISVTQAVDLDTIETNANNVPGIKTKTDFISVTQAVNLDTIETNSDASKVKTDFITITQAVNLDTLESDTVTNNAKVSNATHTGEVTGATALTITADAVTNTKLANMAVNTIKGRITAGTGDPEDLTATQVRTITETETTTQLNTRDTDNRARANHTGTQTASTISDFDSATRAQTEAELLAGTNITITPSGTGATRQLTIASTGGGGGTITTQDEGSNLSTTVTTLNFTGAGVTASGAGATTTINIPGGGGGSPTFTTTATAGATTTLTSSSNDIQEFTGTLNQTVQLPVVSTLSLGRGFRIVNNSIGIIPVNSSGGNLVTAVMAGKNCDLTCILITGTTPASWEVIYDEPILTKSNMSANNSPLFTTINKFDTLQTNFYGTGTVALDTTTEAEGTGCMKLTLATAGVTGPRINLPGVTNFLKKSFTMKVKASDWSAVSTAEILFATEVGFTNYFVFRWKGTNGKLVTPPNGEWIERTFNPGDFPNGDKVGTPTWGAITHYIVRGQASSGTPDLWFDDFKAMPCSQKPMVCVTYDDGLLTQFTNGKAKLDQHDIRGSFYTIWNEVGGANNMTGAQLDTLSLQGHDICGHGGTNLTTLTQAQRIADLQATKKWIKKYRGSDHYALPNGAYNDAVIADVLPYFSTIANIDWLSNTKEYTPSYILNRFSPDSGTSTATIQAWIDQAIANGNSLIIAWHGIVASGATGAQVNQSTYDTIMDYIGTKKQAGLLDTGTLSDYYGTPIQQYPQTNPIAMASRILDSWGGGVLTHN